MLALPLNQTQGLAFVPSNIHLSADRLTTSTISGSSLQPPAMIAAVQLRPMACQNSKRPKLSLQTSMLPPATGTALSGSAGDTPTSRNTIANSLSEPGGSAISNGDRSPRWPDHRLGEKSCPYGPDSINKGILKNTPLANLIRLRREQSNRVRSPQRKPTIAFVEEPQIIPRPPQDSAATSEDPKSTETSPIVGNGVFQAGRGVERQEPASLRSGRPRADSSEWRRRRMQRSAGQQLGQDGALGSDSSSSISVANSQVAASGGMSSSGNIAFLDERPPQTPETPSPRRTRDWIWTLGDDFNSPSSLSHQVIGSSVSADAKTVGTNNSVEPEPRRIKRVPTGFVYQQDGASLSELDTPSTSTTPMTPLSVQTSTSNPETPITPASVSSSSATSRAADQRKAASQTSMNLQISIPVRTRSGNNGLGEREKEEKRRPLTPRSVPLPDTPRLV